jgi:hypothetical protein
MTFKINDRVMLKVDVGIAGLRAGSLGTVAETNYKSETEGRYTGVAWDSIGLSGWSLNGLCPNKNGYRVPTKDLQFVSAAPVKVDDRFDNVRRIKVRKCQRTSG